MPKSKISKSLPAAQQQKEAAFDVILDAVGDRKINVIKAVREVTNLGLKEAKDLVESAPSVIKAGISREEAEAIKNKFEEAHATASIAAAERAMQTREPAISKSAPPATPQKPQANPVLVGLEMTGVKLAELSEHMEDFTLLMNEHQDTRPADLWAAAENLMSFCAKDISNTADILIRIATSKSEVKGGEA